MVLNCGVGEDSWESLGLQKRSNQSILKEMSPEYSSEGLMLKLRLQYFSHLTQLKRPWYWERLKVGGEGEGREWDVWLASPTHWMWALVSSGSWWWTGRSGTLQSMGSQRVRHNWVTEMNWYTYISHFKLQEILNHLFLYNYIRSTYFL